MRPPHITPTLRLLLNFTTAAFVLRLLRIQDESLWVDEGVTWANATRGTLSDALVAEANHPPLWWLVTRAVVAFAGDGPLALRAPAAALSGVAVVLAYLLARRLLDPARVPSHGGFTGLDAHAPIWVAGLSAASAFSIEYAQEARMYAALLAESLGLTLLYLRWLDRGRRGTLVAYAVLAVLALHTHLFAVWPILGHAWHALYAARPRRGDAVPARSPAPFLLAQGVAVLCFVPWLVVLVHAYRRVAPGEGHDPLGMVASALWRMGTGPGIVALDRPRVDAGPARMLEECWPQIALASLAWFIPIALGVRAAWRDRGLRALVLACVAVPLVLLLAVSPWFPLIHEKYLIFLAPFLTILAVLGARSARGVARVALLGGLVALHAAGLVAYHAAAAEPAQRVLGGGHAYGKEQWADVARWVRERAQGDDLVLLHGRWEAVGGPGRTTPLLEPVWSYYGKETPPAEFLPETALGAADLAREFPRVLQAKRVFLVLSHEETIPKDHYRRVLDALLRSRGLRETDSAVADRSWGIRAFEWSEPAGE